MLDFESTFKQLDKFWIEISTACQILIQLFYHPSDIESKTSKSIRFWYIFFQKKNLFGILAFQKSFFSVVVFFSKNLKLSFFTLFPKNWFWGRFLWGKTFYESKFLKRIRCRFNFCTTPQFLNPECSKMSNFEPTSCSSSKFESRFL